FGKAAPGASYPALYTSAKIGGVRGVFRSDDAGAHWVRINDDAHQWGWTGATITGDPRVHGRVYVATNGRGIIQGDTGGTGPGPTDPPAPAGACKVAYKVTNQWQGGFQADVTLTNTSTAPWTGWTLGWTFGAGQTVGQAWNATAGQNGAAVTVRDAGWNGTVPAGASASFGFTGGWTGTNPAPAAFTLGGTPCATG
ncbi:cellulose-binding domain-containing protein, partial [Streptomyces sp.]